MPKKSVTNPNTFSTYLEYVKPPAHQRILKKIKKSTAAIVRERNNHVDGNACKVLIRGQMVGYLPADVAREVAPVIDAGDWTYAIPYLKTRLFDGVVYVDISVEPRRPGPGIIGAEHATRPESWFVLLLRLISRQTSSEIARNDIK